MPTGDTQLIRFLQQECARLKDENQVLRDEMRALHRYLQALQSLQETVQHFTPEQNILAMLDDTLRYALELLDASDGSLMLIDEETDAVFILPCCQADFDKRIVIGLKTFDEGLVQGTRGSMVL